jgi:hypothetical protein
LAVLRDYIRSFLATAAPADPEKIAVSDAQYRKWVAQPGSPISVRPAPNGIAFMPGYKDWKVISSTVRNDTKTLKLILGNDVAMAAIARNSINTWPNGTILAKVSWSQQADANGVIEPGEFQHMALMIKNDREYAATAGWGWAQWGSTLTPDGKNADFSAECVACHSPLRQNDYVFTFPTQSQRSSE